MNSLDIIYYFTSTTDDGMKWSDVFVRRRHRPGGDAEHPDHFRFIATSYKAYACRRMNVQKMPLIYEHRAH